MHNSLFLIFWEKKKKNEDSSENAIHHATVREASPGSGRAFLDIASMQATVKLDKEPIG